MGKTYFLERLTGDVAQSHVSLTINAAELDPQRGERTLKEIRTYCAEKQTPMVATNVFLQAGKATVSLQAEIDRAKDLLERIHADKDVSQHQKTRWTEFLAAYRMRLKRSQRGTAMAESIGR